MEATEHRIRVPRTARYRVLGDPASADEVWFVLHGYRQLAERFIVRFAELPGVAGGSRAVVAPEALSRFYLDDDGGEHGPDATVGATWMTRVDRESEIRDYVEYLDLVAEAVLDGGAGAASAARRRVVLGFSQGAATASRWVTHGRIDATELVLWGSGLAADLDMDRAREALAGVAISMVVGAADRWGRDRAAESRERLVAVGLTGRVIEFDGGHEIPGQVLSEHWPG